MEVPQLRNETETTKEGISQLIFHQLLIHLSFIFSSFLLQDIFPPKKNGYSYSHFGFPDTLVGKESACNTGDPGLISGSEDPLEKG